MLKHINSQKPSTQLTSQRSPKAWLDVHSYVSPALAVSPLHLSKDPSIPPHHWPHQTQTFLAWDLADIWKSDYRRVSKGTCKGPLMFGKVSRPKVGWKTLGNKLSAAQLHRNWSILPNPLHCPCNPTSDGNPAKETFPPRYDVDRKSTTQNGQDPGFERRGLSFLDRNCYRSSCTGPPP